VYVLLISKKIVTPPQGLLVVRIPSGQPSACFGASDVISFPSVPQSWTTARVFTARCHSVPSPCLGTSTHGGNAVRGPVPAPLRGRLGQCGV
jgi:hypothetical protein